MTAYTKRIVIVIIMMIVVACSVVWTIQQRFFKEQLLTAEQASKKVEALYGGSVAAFEKVEDGYMMSLERQGAIYDVEIDAATGNISALTLVTLPLKKSEQQIREIVQSKTKGQIQQVVFNAKNSQYTVEVLETSGVKTFTVDAMTGNVLSQQLKSVAKEPVRHDVVAESNNRPTETNNMLPKPATSAIISKTKAIEIARAQFTGEVDHVDYEKTTDGGYYLIEIENSEDEVVFQIHAVSGKVMSVTQEDQQADEEDHED